MPVPRVHGGIQHPGLTMVAVQLVVQHQAVAGGNLMLPPLCCDCACGLGCNPKFLVPVFLEPVSLAFPVIL